MAKYKKNYQLKKLPDRIVQRLKAEDKRVKLQQRLNKMLAEGKTKEGKILRRKIIQLNLDAVQKTMKIPEKKQEIAKLHLIESKLIEELRKLQ